MTHPAPDGPPDVSVLVVGYNSAGFISECLESLFNQTSRTNFEVLLIDNGDGSTEALVTDRFPAVRIVPAEGNIGFAAGNNRLAAKARGRYLLLLNPDTVLREPAVDRLVAFADSTPDAAVWGGIEIDQNGSVVIGPGELPTLSGLVGKAVGVGRGTRYSDRATDRPVRVDVMSGCFMMIRADVWQKLDGFDESFFLYSEEVDLFARIKADGGLVWVTPEARIEHASASGEALSASRFLFKHKGAMHYAWKHWGRLGGALGGALYWGIAAQRYAVNRAMAGRSEMRRQTADGLAPIVRHPGKWWHGYRRSDPRGSSWQK